jgi:hypothetical protein
MTNQHPITLPPAILQKLRSTAPPSGWPLDAWIAEQAAQWAADRELKACVEWLADDDDRQALQTHRRPKPPSLKEQALEILQRLSKYQEDSDWDTIRRALEALPE